MARALRPSHQRGWRVMLWACGVFVAAQLVAGLLIDTCWQRVRFPSAAEVFRQIEAGRKRGPDILFLGSSRFGSSIVPGVIQPRLRARTGDRDVEVRSGWVPGGDAFAEDYVLEHLLAHGASPRLVVMEIMPENLTPHSMFVGEHVHRQATWVALPALLCDTLGTGHFARLLAGRLLPLYVHRREISRELWAWACAAADPPIAVPGSEEPPAPGPNGWHGPAESYKPAVAELYGKLLRNYRVGGPVADALERLLQRCREHGIDVILVTNPVWSFQRQLYSPEVNDAFRAYVDRLRDSYGCCFIDCRDQVPDEYFADHHHFILTGAWYYSRKFTDNVLVPYWNQHRSAGVR